ncbi:response regulator transcription factor [Microbacteriaceae bacterium VKM Ac-2855]|nr:response regulator transcription factor [Microbacteriaceae bacterium VKM Ac-2855]
MRVLLVEDDPGIRSIIERALREAGHAVDDYVRSDEALMAAELEPFDLLILDVMLPGSIDGIELCRRVRTTKLDVPILILTALDSPRRRVEGLDAGADDYLVKPFHLAELLARVRALLRRAPRADPPQLDSGVLHLNPATMTVENAGHGIALTSKEFAVLEYLMRSPDRVITRSELIDHLWDANYDGYSNVVASCIRRLRHKLTEHGGPDPISTRRGTGYILESRTP